MEKYLNITKPSYSEQVLPVPWHFARCSALDTASTQFYTLRILILAMGRCHLHGKTGNSVGRSNGSRHSAWEVSGNMGCDLRQCNFSTLFSLFS